MATTRLKGSAEAIQQLGRDPARGQVFWWLYDEYDAIRVRPVGKQIPWRILLGQIQKLGLTNADGRSITREKALKLTFSRVAKLKRQEAEAKQQRADSRKRPVGPPPVVTVSASRPAPPRTPTPSTAAQPDDTVDAQLAALDAQMKRRSGYRV